MTGINNTAVIEKKSIYKYIILVLAGDDKSLSDYESVINDIVMPNDKHVF